jgi:hypothetical protein
LRRFGFGVVSLVYFIGLVALAAPFNLRGSWFMNVTVVPQSDPIGALNAVLTFSSSLAGVDWTSTSAFTKAGYHQQAFTVDTLIWVFDVHSTLAFLPTALRTDFWLTRVDTAMAGVFFTYTFLLEYVSAADDFGSGAELRVAAQFPDHVSVGVTNLFGLEENLAEVYGWVSGSGYDIVNRPNLHALTYTSTKVDLNGLKVGSCPLALTITFTKEGFKSIFLDLRFTPTNLPIEFDLQAEITTFAKAVVLYPSVNLGQACLEVYAHIVPWAFTLGDATMTGVSIDGIGLKCEIGPTVFSGLIATDSIYRPRTASSDIPLRARNYVVEPNPFLAVHYIKTNYNAVFSLEWPNDYWFAVDFYFSETVGGLFGLALVTVEAGVQLCDQINFGIGAAFGVTSLPMLTFTAEVHF